jgi:hypothetical protein
MTAVIRLDIGVKAAYRRGFPGVYRVGHNLEV